MPADSAYGVVHISVCNLRDEGKFTSGMSTQALLGMPVKVLQYTGWYEIQTPDDYTGWVHRMVITPMSKERYNEWNRAEKIVVTAHYGFTYEKPDFRLNKTFDRLGSMTCRQKDKVEFLCNECCWFGCNDRKKCYEAVSRKNLGENISEHICSAPGSNEGYRFSKAMKNPGFIGVNDIKDKYISMGFSNFKIEGRGLGSALILEFLLYYMTKPEYHVHVREKVYLDNMLDLF